jgi:hypothetical protein
MEQLFLVKLIFACLQIFLKDALHQFFTQNLDVLGCGKTELDRIAFDAKHLHLDVVADHDRFARLSSQDEH